MKFRKPLFGVSASLIFSAVVVLAQEPLADCAAMLQSAWSAATTACVSGAEGTICNGGSPVQAEPAGAISNTLASSGAMIENDLVTALRTPAIDAATNTAGIAWLRTLAPLSYTALLIGDVSMQNVTPPDFPPWTSFILQTGADTPMCGGAPNNLLILQNAFGQPTRVVVNGASIALNGTVVARTSGADTIFVAISGESSVQVFGSAQPLVMGQQLAVPYNPGDFTRPADVPGLPIPYDPAPLQHLPVALFPRPIVLPQPGFVRTAGDVNLRSGPSTDAGIITQVPSGEVMSVLGGDPSGLWYHIRRESGETGWMLAELLSGNVGPIQSVYDATPLPPQRMGEMGTGGRVLAPAGVNLRSGPDASFPSLALLSDGAFVQLVARSPYSPWIKVDHNGAVGWVALITLDTQAFLDAIPIDFNVPPPPTPTRMPGTFGNAFPDPHLDN